jgi:[CysO sulfur-carrier protein]-S-L-cysteine hydrolase
VTDGPLPSSPMLELRADVHESMVAHALRGLPDEACGLFAAQPGSGLVERFFPMTNAAASSQIYRLDGKEFLAVEHEADAAGLEIVGVMHSHTHTSAYPSPTDVADAEMADPFGTWHFVIVSLKFAEPALRSFRILDGAVDEEAVRVRVQ